MMLIKSTFAESEYFLTDSVEKFCKKKYLELKKKQKKQGFDVPYFGCYHLYNWEDWKDKVFDSYYRILDLNIQTV